MREIVHNFPHPGCIACCSAPNSRPPATKALHTICGNNTSLVSSSWWWAYKCPKHVEQIISGIKQSLASSWFSSLHLWFLMFPRMQCLHLQGSRGLKMPKLGEWMDGQIGWMTQWMHCLIDWSNDWSIWMGKWIGININFEWWLGEWKRLTGQSRTCRRGWSIQNGLWKEHN